MTRKKVNDILGEAINSNLIKKWTTFSRIIKTLLSYLNNNSLSLNRIKKNKKKVMVMFRDKFLETR